MKKSKFTEGQIAVALHQAQMGVSVEEVCRKIGVSQATFYAWKRKYAGVGVTELHRLRQLEDENKKRKQLVADLALDKAMLQDALRKKSKAGAARTAHRLERPVLTAANQSWGTDFVSDAFFSSPKKLTDNAFIGSFNGSLRDECLNLGLSMSWEEVRQVQVERSAWRGQSRSWNQAEVP